MKKLLSVVCILCLALTLGFAQADMISDNTLGNPVMNVDDTAILGRYPAALQLFPNSIYARFDGSWDYRVFGLVYKLSDMVGVLFSYDTSMPNSPQQFYTPANAAQGAAYSMPMVANVMYGLKMGDLLAGAASRVYFYQNATLETTRINTNAVEYHWQGISGFKATLNPSAIIALGDMKVYSTVESTLNFTKLYRMRTNATVSNYYTKPAMLERIGLQALVTLPLNDTTLVGAEVKASYAANSHFFQTTTNKVDVYPTTNSWVGGTMEASLGLGARVKATDKTTFFVDAVTLLRQTEQKHKKDIDGQFYNVTSRWYVPSVTLGAQFEVVKNLKVRLSAKPSYYVETIKSASYENFATDQSFSTTVSSFGVATAVGLGYKIGSFSINWQLDNWFLDTLFNSPFTFLDLNGNGPDLATSVQANFIF